MSLNGLAEMIRYQIFLLIHFNVLGLKELQDD